MYANGEGVPQDYVQAFVWFNLAASESDKAAQYRDLVASKMTPAQIAEAQRLVQEWKPKPAAH
jgi:TPR repeat protein